jgi:hypothetical protein
MNPIRNPFTPHQEDICRKFATKVIEYFHLTHIPTTANNLYPFYPLYHIPENEENIGYLHDFLFAYFLYFAKVMKTQKLFIGDFVTAEQCAELSQLANEMEKAIGPIERHGEDSPQSDILIIFGDRTLRDVKKFFKHYLRL